MRAPLELALWGLLVVFGDFLFVRATGSALEVCASDGGEHGGILLIDFLGLVEGESWHPASPWMRGKRTLAYLVESALGFAAKTLVERSALAVV